VNRKKTERLYREEKLTVRRRRGRKKATGTRAPILVEAVPNAHWSVDLRPARQSGSNPTLVALTRVGYRSYLEDKAYEISDTERRI